MARYLNLIFSCPRDEYTCVPPVTLLKKCSIPLEAVDRVELERAIWLWQRRPKDVLYNGKKLLWGRLCLAGAMIVGLTLFDIPGLLVAAALSFAGALFMFLHYYNREYWKRDYEAALYRVVRPSDH
ncbi:MAG: hypothetical protein JO151_17555 [Verrucomicrobia bacterium]|nr:hypothetical protein [Verrucomicrobiota bacterium]